MNARRDLPVRYNGADGRWHRGRIVDVDDDCGLVLVQCGYSQVVERLRIEEVLVL